MPARIPMTQRQRAALLALPDSEAAVVRHHGLDAEDLAAIGFARTPATRLSYALQLCCLRYPGRHLRTGELLPAIMLDHIAEQVGVDAGVVADFARRAPTRYDQLAAIKARFGFTDLSRPARGIMMTWLETEAMAIVDGRILLDRLLDELRTRRIVIPGISVVERMAAEAMLRTETDLVAAVDAKLDADMRQRLDMLIDEKVHDRQSRLSWLREPEPRVASASLAEILEKVAIIHRTGISSIPVDPLHEPRLTQFAREGVRYTAQAFQQMRVSRRRVILLATLREMEATLTDAAIAMFSALMGRAHLRARKRLEQRVAISGRDLTALHVDGGGVSDIVFATMHLLGLDFEPRIPRLSDRRLYAFEPSKRYGRLAPLFGHRLNRDLIVSHWPDIERVIGAIRHRTVTPSLILKKLSAYRQQNSLAAALREIGRIERTLFTLRWFEDPALRRTVTAELNKGEARNSLARAVAFHRLGRFRDRGLENQQTRAAALNLVTAAIILFNCRYLGRAVDEMRRRGSPIDPAMLSRLSPLGWDRINLTGDYVWSDHLDLDANGLMPLLIKPLP